MIHNRNIDIALICLLAILVVVQISFGASISSDFTEATRVHQHRSTYQQNATTGIINHTKETAIVVSTNWIPSAPSIQMLQEVVDSFQMIKGLPSDAPIYIIVDNLRAESHGEGKSGQERWDMEATLDKYSFNIMKEYMHRKNFHVIVNTVNNHIGGNLNKAIELLEPETKYLYYFQHDFKFIKEVNHTAIINSMKEHPDVLKNVRFNRKRNGAQDRKDACFFQKGTELISGANFTRTSLWSDNNHFASVEYYKMILESIVMLTRAIEAPMLSRIRADPTNCMTDITQHQYGGDLEGPYIQHLDGRSGYKASKEK